MLMLIHTFVPDRAPSAKLRAPRRRAGRVAEGQGLKPLCAQADAVGGASGAFGYTEHRPHALGLREHGIWLSKRDNKRDEVLLCSLSNFDAYHITRAHRAPKPFAFAIKSTDSLSFFEDTKDYMHSFACQERDGKEWMEKILVARSYVLHQERHVLFNPKPSGAPNGGTPNGTSNGTGLARSGTRKVAVKPLIAAPPQYSGATVTVPVPSNHADVFEPGSLLGKHH
ncbi:hypothetical protein NLJ89_g4783 [Agrocybe chaxingu]|uniref:PH domain-containing protein n=1 Tax=Agrocybe chaxingu TaxID=84603 RepID=A0A9W8K8A8_9AGAR|nr:hypothetical protein NLJ89_g4783 [Agrocybe chaxingu]